MSEAVRDALVHWQGFGCLRLIPLQVTVYGACLADAATACLVMELVPGGNLAERIYDRNKRRMSYIEILQVRANDNWVTLHITVTSRQSV